MGFSKSSQKMYCREVEENKPNGTELRYSQHTMWVQTPESPDGSSSALLSAQTTRTEVRSPFTSLTMRSMSSCFMALGWRRATSVLPPGFRTNLCSTSSAGECGC